MCKRLKFPKQSYWSVRLYLVTHLEASAQFLFLMFTWQQLTTEEGEIQSSTGSINYEKNNIKMYHVKTKPFICFVQWGIISIFLQWFLNGLEHFLGSRGRMLIAFKQKTWVKIRARVLELRVFFLRDLIFSFVSRHVCDTAWIYDRFAMCLFLLFLFIFSFFLSLVCPYLTPCLNDTLASVNRDSPC